MSEHQPIKSRDVCDAADLAWKAVQRYATRAGLCHGCLSVPVVVDMLYHTTKNLVAHEATGDFIAEVYQVLEQGIKDRRTSQGHIH